MSKTIAETKGVAINITLLLAILLHNLTYPLSTIEGVWPATFYLFYATIFVAATWALTADTRLRCLVSLTGFAVLISGPLNSYRPSDAAALAIFLTSIA